MMGLAECVWGRGSGNPDVFLGRGEIVPAHQGLTGHGCNALVCVIIRRDGAQPVLVDTPV